MFVVVEEEDVLPWPWLVLLESIEKADIVVQDETTVSSKRLNFVDDMANKELVIRNQETVKGSCVRCIRVSWSMSSRSENDETRSDGDIPRHHSFRNTESAESIFMNRYDPQCTQN